jgi:hypothetical protein
MCPGSLEDAQFGGKPVHREQVSTSFPADISWLAPVAAARALAGALVVAAAVGV